MTDTQAALDEVMSRLDASDRELVLSHALEYAKEIAIQLDRAAEFAKAVKGFRPLGSSDLRAVSGPFRAVLVEKSGERHFQVGEDVSSIQEALRLLRTDETHPSLKKRIYDKEGNSILLRIRQLSRGDKFRRIDTPPDNPLQFDDLLELTWLSYMEARAGFKRLSDGSEWQNDWSIEVVRVINV